MKLPTKLGRLLLTSAITNRLEDEKAEGVTMLPTVLDVIAAYQRMALVTDFDESLKTVIQYFRKTKRILAVDSEDYKALQLCYDLTRKDLLGHAVEAIAAVTTTGVSSDKLAAAAVISELFGDKKLIDDVKLTDRLMINLVAKGEK